MRPVRTQKYSNQVLRASAAKHKLGAGLNNATSINHGNGRSTIPVGAT